MPPVHPSPPTDKECTIEATLKDENGNPLSNMNIDFTECGQRLFGTNKTDSNGVASLKLTLTEQDFLIKATNDTQIKERKGIYLLTENLYKYIDYYV